MARTALTAQSVTSGGLTATYSAANVEGHSFRLQGSRVLHVKNGGGSSVTVTVPTPGTVDGLAVADRTYTVAAAGETFIGLGAGSAYRQSDGTAQVDFSGVTSVTVALLDVP